MRLPKIDLKLGIKRVSTFVLCLVLLAISTAPIYAKSLEEINLEISQKQESLDKLKADLKAAQDDYNAKKSVQDSASSEANKLQAEIDALNAEVLYNTYRIQEIEENKLLKELEKQQNEKRQDLQVLSSYVNWKTGEEQTAVFSGKDLVKNSIYNEALNTRNHGGILGIALELKELEDEYSYFVSSSAEMQTKINELNEKKKEVEIKLAAARNEANKSGQNLNSLNRAAGQIQSDITFLSKEQQDIEKEQQRIYNETGTSNISEEVLISGEFYFEGRGSDFVTGHGIGMSQWGAFGAATSLGWSYKQIVEFYFPGAKVMKLDNLPANINVTNWGTMSLEDYVSGLGEVGDKACEDINSTNKASGCWPKEAILAQMVVARTFGARRAGGICASDACQVYKGGLAKKWAADATQGEVVVFNGSMADVYYSADNNQGAGNADKTTVWGGATIPYLTSVNDNAFAIKPYFGSCKGWCGNWTWRTYSYSSGSLLNFFNWASNSGYSSGKTSFNALKGIGTINSIILGKDPSGRVNRLTFKGANGEASVTGKIFRENWNLWNQQTKPSGQRDLMYSFTYNSKVK